MARRTMAMAMAKVAVDSTAQRGFATPATPSAPSRCRCRVEVLSVKRGQPIFLAMGVFAVPLKGLVSKKRRFGCRQKTLCGRGGSLESKLELSSEFDAEDPELRVEAANQVGAMNVTSALWPPKRQQADPTELSPVQQETTVGRFTGSAPAFGAWPFYQADYTEFPAELQPLSEKDKELEIYKVVDFVSSSALTRAFALASRWQKQNLGRSAGFDRLGAGVLSGFKYTNPILLRQLQGLNVLLSWREERQGGGPGPLPPLSEEGLLEFLLEVGASDFTQKEFRAVAPVGREALVTGLVGTSGSALAIWTKGSSLDIQICLGHDCLDQGPVAEERLLRLLAGRARACSLQLRCRGRFTEKGKLLVPCKALNFKLVPGEKHFAEDTSDQDALSDPYFNKAKIFEAIPEAVPGLRTWLLLLCLEEQLGLVNEWCDDQGAATLEEVIESRADLADFLTERGDLTPGERQALMERDR